MFQNVARVVYKSLQQFKTSYKKSKGFLSVRQRAGDRIITMFTITFALSIFMNYYIFRLESSIQKGYKEYRAKLQQSLKTKKQLVQ